jgi:hypothetical protein
MRIGRCAPRTTSRPAVFSSSRLPARTKFVIGISMSDPVQQSSLPGPRRRPFKDIPRELSKRRGHKSFLVVCAKAAHGKPRDMRDIQRTRGRPALKTFWRLIAKRLLETLAACRHPGHCVTGGRRSGAITGKLPHGAATKAAPGATEAPTADARTHSRRQPSCSARHR